MWHRGATADDQGMRMPRPVNLASGMLAGALAALALAAPANAATCAGKTSQPFAPWGDFNFYELAPNGTLESTNGWTLTGGAKLVKGSEPFAVTGRLGQYSLSIPAGATASSPVMCLDEARPTFRFFARAAEGAAASLSAEALADKPAQVAALGSVAGTTEWAPVAPLSTGASGLLIDRKGTVPVRLRFVADQGEWQIDDVFVDPRKMG
jgi:hypothetical protein